MDIKRYNIFMDGFEGFWDCEESPTGDWIKASDHDAIVTKLNAENEELKNENEALRAENEALRNAFNDICSCHTNSEYNKALSKIRALIKSQSAKGE